MSEPSVARQARRWLDQAGEDLEAARVLSGAARYAQACFYCQQAAEKALKAVGWSLAADLWGHSLLQLRDGLAANGGNVDSLSESDLVALDRFYIPTRYPDALPDIIPQRAFLRDDAESGLRAAERILAFASAAIQQRFPEPPAPQSGE